MRMMSWRVMVLNLALLTTFSLCGSHRANAQYLAKITAALNQVVARNTVSGHAVIGNVGVMLVAGDSVRTGGRSSATVTFNDGSALRLGELTEITIRPARFNDTRVSSGSVFGTFTGPGRVSGRYGVAAVRGTRMALFINGDQETFADYNAGGGVHLVDVVHLPTQIVTVRVTTFNGNTVQSDRLIGDGEDWTNARFILLESDMKINYRVTGFDPITGTITLDRPLPASTHDAEYFTLVLPADAQIVTIRPGQQTNVMNIPGSIPTPPQSTPSENFAGGQENPSFFNSIDDRNIENYTNGPLYETFQQEFFELDSAFQDTRSYDGIALGIQPTFIPPNSGGTGIGTPGSGGSGSIGTTVPGSGSAGGVGTTAPGSNGAGGVGTNVPVSNGAGGVGIRVPGSGGTGGVGISVPGSGGAGGVGIKVPGSSGSGGTGVSVPGSAGAGGIGIGVPGSGGAGGVGIGVPGSSGAGGVGVRVPGSGGAGGVGIGVPGSGGAGGVGIGVPGSTGAGGVGVRVPGSGGAGGVGIGVPGSTGAGGVGVGVPGSAGAGGVGTTLPGSNGAGGVGVGVPGSGGAGGVGVRVPGSGGAGGVGIGVPGSTGAGGVGTNLPGSAGAGSVGTSLPGSAGAGSVGTSLPGSAGAGSVGTTLPGSGGAGTVTTTLPGAGAGGVAVTLPSSAGAGGLIVMVGQNPPDMTRMFAPTRSFLDIHPNKPQFGALGYTSGNGNAALAYANYSATTGNFFVRVGARVGYLGTHNETLFDEAMVRYREKGIGDIRAGRIHWFPGPSSNNTLGRLISFYTADGVLWRLPHTGPVSVEAAYFGHINPFVGPQTSGFVGRVSGFFHSIHLGATAIAGSSATGRVGESFDVSTPVVRQELDAFGEVGQDLLRNQFYSAGFYVPYFYKRYKTDVYLEHAQRQTYGSETDLIARFPIGSNFRGIANISKFSSLGWRPGIGLELHF